MVLPRPMTAAVPHALRGLAPLLAAGGLLLAACHRSETTSASAGNGSAPGAGPLVAYPAEDYIEQQKGTPGGTLRVSTASDTGTLDFHLIAATNPKWLGRLLYDNLVYLDHQGNYTPWLAKSWTISPDGKTYTFHLRDDVTFSDGVKFNAEAVLVNLTRIRDPRTRASMTTAYIAPYVDGKVLDEYTFQANLREPYSAFLNVLAQSWLGMMSPKAIRENPAQMAEKPVGSGPFVVESYTRQQGIKFVKRPDYHWAPDFIRHDGPAYLDRIEVSFVPEAMIRYSSLASGQHDFTIDAPPQNAAAIRADKRLVLGNRINLGNPTRAITFNVTKEPFQDVRVRKAVALAIDREGIAQIIGFGEYLPKTDFLSANTRYYDPAYREILKYDLTAANRLLDEAGWTSRDADGIRTREGRRLSAEIMVVEAFNPSAAVIAMQSDLKKIGFELTIVQVPVTRLSELRNSNAYQALGAGYWHTNTPDGLFIVYHGKQISTPDFIGQNTSRLSDPELDDLLTRARHANDATELRDLYSKAQKRLTEVLPAVPLFENHTLLAHQQYVKGVVYDTSHNMPFFTCTWLDPKHR